jgi:hypothetical protein
MTHSACSRLCTSIAAELERRAEEIVAAYLKAGIQDGDWRALDALVSRVHGKPKETVETVEASRTEQAIAEEPLEQRRARLIELGRMGHVPQLRAVD